MMTIQRTYAILALAFLATACNGPDQPADPGTPAAKGPRTMTFSILNTFPHDTAYYTQGLEFYQGKLYEGTGSGSAAGSFLMQIDQQTGKANRKIALDKELFGEGISIMNDTVYQLTWQNRKAFAYHVKDFKKIAEYSINHEGWGLTNNGKELIASDGSSKLYYYEPGSFRLLRTQSITEGGALSYNLNELEYVNGFVYANQYQFPYIFKIDPGSGTVVAKADLSDLWDRVKKLKPDVDVPNGIAYDSTKKTFFITGKLWPEMYEVQFSE